MANFDSSTATGGSFAGQEVDWFASEPLGAMHYFGRIRELVLIDTVKAGRVIKAALMHCMAIRSGSGRPGVQPRIGHYTDESRGAADNFSGKERIVGDGLAAFELD